MQTKQYFSLEPARFKLDGGAMFGIIPKPLWNKVHPSDEENRIELALRLVLIKDGNKNILIDTGIGDYHGDKFDSRFGITKGHSPLESALAVIGLTTDDITDLVVSHLHFDHIGGLTQFVDGKLQPVLKNATIHLHEKHWQYSHHPTQRDTGSFQREYFIPTIQWYIDHGKVQFYQDLEGQLSCGLKYKCSMGHTPYLMHAYDENFIYMADLVPTSNHVHIPWVMGYDISPGVTTTDKSEFYEFIEKQKLTMIFEHDPVYLGCDLVKNEKNEIVAGLKIKASEKMAYQIFN